MVQFSNRQLEVAPSCCVIEREFYPVLSPRLASIPIGSSHGFTPKTWALTSRPGLRMAVFSWVGWNPGFALIKQAQSAKMLQDQRSCNLPES